MSTQFTIDFATDTIKALTGQVTRQSTGAHYTIAVDQLISRFNDLAAVPEQKQAVQEALAKFVIGEISAIPAHDDPDKIGAVAQGAGRILRAIDASKPDSVLSKALHSAFTATSHGLVRRDDAGKKRLAIHAAATQLILAGASVNTSRR